MSSNGDQPRKGFEYQGTFYTWHCSDLGKDLMLIDRISGMSVVEFFETIEDDAGRERAPVLLALIATSVRHGHPDWSVERIHRLVLNLSLSDVAFVGDDDQDEGEGAPQAGPPELLSTDELSRSPATGSSSSPTPAAGSSSPTSSATPA